jgi:predicted AAA+ superfamily ATPase
MFRRGLRLPPAGRETFFLWGPRQTGKTTLLRDTYSDSAIWLDLLKADEYRRYLERPETLREELAAIPKPGQVVIDEVQKIPALLDEVHWLHEHRKVRFALCGSSARTVRRGGGNLLGGRAIRYELFGLTASEIGKDFDLVRMLNHGYLPTHYESDAPDRQLAAYVGDYLKEEVAAEGLVRNLAVFSSFLGVAALADGELVNFTNIARECGVSSPTVKGHFGILEDTLLGAWLPGYTRRPKRRVIAAPKFFFADVGVVNHLAKRGRMVPGSELFGKAFENWVFHELRAAISYGTHRHELSYWRLASGIEVDFIVGQMSLAVEAKATAKVTANHLKGLRHLHDDHPRVRRVMVSLEPRRRHTDDGIEILPVKAFVDDLGGLLRAV